MRKIICDRAIRKYAAGAGAFYLAQIIAIAVAGGLSLKPIFDLTTTWPPRWLAWILAAVLLILFWILVIRHISITLRTAVRRYIDHANSHALDPLAVAVEPKPQAKQRTLSTIRKATEWPENLAPRHANRYLGAVLIGLCLVAWLLWHAAATKFTKTYTIPVSIISGALLAYGWIKFEACVVWPTISRFIDTDAIDRELAQLKQNHQARFPD